MSQVWDYMTLHNEDYKLDNNIQSTHCNKNTHDNSTSPMSMPCKDTLWIHYSLDENIIVY